MDGLPLMEASKRQRRVEAVLALFRGVPAAQVATQFGICRSDLYKFRRRALTAIHQALDDQPRGPKRPHNRLDPKTEGGDIHVMLTLRRCSRQVVMADKHLDGTDVVVELFGK
jgi:transposase-like protein